MEKLISKLDDYDYTQREVLDMAYNQGRADERTKIINIFKTFIYDINVEEINAHIGTDAEVSWLINWRNAFENELQKQLKEINE